MASKHIYALILGTTGALLLTSCGKPSGFVSAGQVTISNTKPNSIEVPDTQNQQSEQDQTVAGREKNQTRGTGHKTLDDEKPKGSGLQDTLVHQSHPLSNQHTTTSLSLTGDDVALCTSPDETTLNSLVFKEVRVSDSQQAYLTSLHTYQDVVYAAINEKINSSKAGIYRSIDGINFSKIHPHVSVNSVTSGNGKVYFATNLGVLATSDKGLSFSKVSDIFFEKLIFDGKHLIGHGLYSSQILRSDNEGKSFSVVDVPLFDNKQSSAGNVSYFWGLQKWGFSFLEGGSRFVKVDSTLQKFENQNITAQKLHQNCDGEVYLVSGENNSHNQLRIHYKAQQGEVVSNAVSTFFAIESIRGFGKNVVVVATSSSSATRGDTFAVSNDLGKTWRIVPIEKSSANQGFESFYFYNGRVFIRSNDRAAVWGLAKYFVSQ